VEMAVDSGTNVDDECSTLNADSPEVLYMVA
jgi:hypothetical protein